MAKTKKSNVTENTTTTTKEEKTMKKQNQEQELVVKENASKENARIEEMFTALKSAQCKKDLVDTMNAYGYRTTTIPTTTPNKNDLYIQLSDKSRVLFTSKSIKVYTNQANAEGLQAVNKDFQFDLVNDGSYRTKRTTIGNNLENFTTVFNYFLGCGFIEALPTLK